MLGGREDVASDGADVNDKDGDDGTSDGDDGTSDGDDGTSDGDDVTSDGDDVTSDGDDGTSDGTDVNVRDGDFGDVGVFKLSTYTRTVACAMSEPKGPTRDAWMVMT